MGATNIHYSIPRGDLSPAKAYQQLVDEAIYEYGNDSYNGTISTTSGFKIVRTPENDDEYERILDSCDKWGKCACYVKDDQYHFVGWASV